MKRWNSLNVMSGSGRSRRNFLSKAASWTGLSSDRLTEPESRSSASVRSLSRRMLPFLRKMPSIDMSARVRDVRKAGEGRGRGEERTTTDPSASWPR